MSPKVESIYDHYDSESAIATEIRRLFSNILVNTRDRRAKSFMITSSDRGEGKSTIASLLAISAARSRRQKVLIVDADLRRPRLSKVFQLSNARGFGTCLQDGLNPMEVVQKTPLGNLDVITSGGARSNPAMLFETEHLAEFFAKVKFYYDVVIVDSPPVVPVSDTLFLCSEVEAILLVILAGETPQQVVFRAKELLTNAKAQITGVIVNNAMDVLPYYYSSKTSTRRTG